MREIGFRVVESDTGGRFATGLRIAATFPIWGPSRLLGGPRTIGESALFLAQKTEPDQDLKSPIDYRNRWSGIPDRIRLQA